MSHATTSELWETSVPASPWWQEDECFTNQMDTGAYGWPEIRYNRLVLKLDQADDWGHEPLPPVEDIEITVPNRIHEATSDASSILAELEAMRTEQDEPDFIHSVKDHAYDIARPIIKSAYTHYLGATPTPALAPDGDGGLIVEWKTGEHEVRLIAAHSKDHKSYVYSKGSKTAKIDYELSGFVLAKVLRATFTE